MKEVLNNIEKYHIISGAKARLQAELRGSYRSRNTAGAGYNLRYNQPSYPWASICHYCSSNGMQKSVRSQGRWVKMAKGNVGRFQEEG